MAVWMKPLRDGALLAVYRPHWGGWEEDLAEHWIVQLPRGTDFHWDVLDKTHRIRWLLGAAGVYPSVGSVLWKVKILKFEVRGVSHTGRKQQRRRMWGQWHRGHKHMWTKRRVRPWEGLDFGTESRHSMPRKIEAAMLPKLTQRREYEQYMNKLREQWAREEEEADVLL